MLVHLMLELYGCDRQLLENESLVRRALDEYPARVDMEKVSPVHLYQIWILPEKKSLQPSYEQKSFPTDEKQGKLRLIASPDAKDGSVKINQDAQLYVTLLKPGEQVAHDFGKNRHGWLQVAKGSVQVNGQTLEQGDGAAISDEPTLSIRGAKDSEVLLFDLA